MKNLKMWPHLVLTAVLAASHATALGSNQQPTCGFASCHKLKDEMVNVHMVPHSHDDLGWHKTVDEYFFGWRNYVQDANVSLILDSVFAELKTDPAKRFIQVETAYLWMWWQHQNQSTQEQYRELVQSGRVQITGGGWSMPDEATTNYQSLIDNFSWGFKFLNDSFGPCGIPDVGWQIDPFGHSRETASIMAAMGFQGTFLNRVDYQDFAARKRQSRLEFLWDTSENLGPSSQLFTSLLFGQYTPPLYCCFDILCNEADITDDNITDYQDFIVDTFTKYVDRQAKRYKTNNVLITMGSDFTYMDAPKFYKNIDKLISLINKKQKHGSKLNLVYSTPSCYLKAVHVAQPTLAVKTDDFFPYASEAEAYWTGYYTSRPTVKYWERLGHNFLQVSKQLSVLAGLDQKVLTPLDDLRGIMGVLQHHDAVTGTERAHVARDYVKTLLAAMGSSLRIDQTAVNTLLSPTTKKEEGARADNSVELKSCLSLNISQCDVSEQNDNFTVTVYNPLSRSVSHYVRLPVKDGSYSVIDLNGVPQTVQLVPIPSPVLQLEGRHSAARQELVFRAVDIPPLGLRTYRVARTSTTAISHQPVSSTYISNSETKVEIDTSTGLLTKITVNGTSIPVSHNMFIYESYNTTNNEDYFDDSATTSRSDGPYMFKPFSNTPSPIAGTASVTTYKGDIVEEIHQTFNKWTSQVIRLYKEEDYVEFEWLVGPIVLNDRGIEPISRFSSSLRSDGVFYTDSNGREMLKRKLNYRQSWNVNITQEVSGNYYPVTSRIVIKDEDKGLEMAVLTDRSQGGSSLADGQIELMLHRRLITDDGFGVDELLNDPAPARGKHYVVVGKSSADGGISLAARQRLLAQRKLLQPWVFLSSTDTWPSNYKHQHSGLKMSLQDNVQLLTLEPWGDGKTLVRLEHIMEKSDDPKLSSNVTVDIQDMFDRHVRSARETTLDGNRWLDDVSRLSWRTAAGNSSAHLHPASHSSSVSLAPMQIRTFILEFA